MSYPKFCMLCNRNVIPGKRFNGVVFLILFILFIIPGILYIIYYFTKTESCPICKGTSFGPARPDTPNKL
jgi:hypothetical protein